MKGPQKMAGVVNTGGEGQMKRILMLES